MRLMFSVRFRRGKGGGIIPEGSAVARRKGENAVGALCAQDARVAARRPGRGYFFLGAAAWPFLAGATRRLNRRGRTGSTLNLTVSCMPLPAMLT